MTDLRPFVRTFSLPLLVLFLSHTCIAFAQGIYQLKQDPSALYGSNALIVLEALKQLSSDSKTGNHFPGLQERDGVPYIPFLDKSQQELLMLKQENSSAQFSITKFMKEKLDPELASQITDEVEQQILLTIHQRAESAALSCEEATNENLVTLCAMCKAEKAYLLSEDNWFSVGLDNHYKDEFATLMYYVQYFIPSARWLVAFSENNICIGSATKAEAFDLNNLLKYVTSKDLCYYTKFGIVPLETHATLDFAGFEYFPIGSNMSYITDLVVKYEIDHSVAIVDDVDLHFSKSWIRSKEVKHLYLGTSHINSNSIPFSMEVATEQEYYYAVSNVLPYFITGSDVLTTLGLGVQQTNLFSVLHTEKGLSDLGSFTLSDIAFKFSRETISAVGITLTLFETVEFAVTPEFSFQELHTTIDIEISTDNGLKANSKLTLEGTVVDSTGTATFSSIAIKTENHTELTFSQKNDLPALNISQLEKIFKAQDDSFMGLLPNEKNFDKLRGYYLVDLTIKVGQGPVPAYFISANLSEEVPDYKSRDCQYVETPEKIGELHAAVAYIGGKLNSRTVLTFPNKGLEQLVLSGNTHSLIDQNLELQGFKIGYMNHDLDTGLYPTVFEELYQGDRYWIRGAFFDLNVEIKACNETAFCNVVHSLLTDNPQVKSVLTGTIEKDRIVLQSQIMQNKTTLPGLTLSNITLNMGLTLNDTNTQVDPYLTFWTALTVPKQDALMLKGTISFNSTHAIMVAKSSQIWENALNLKSLQISQLKITGQVNPGSSDIEGVRAEGIAIWGTECFKVANGTNQSVFDKERCFFGKNEININVKDISKSHITGMYKNLKPSHIISLTDFNVSEHDIPEQFMNLKFTDYVEVKYIPPKVETVLLEVEKAEPLEAGLFIKGASQLYGLQGTTNLKMKSDGKKLAGTFSFTNTEAVFGNILIEGSVDNSDENLNVIELNLLGTEGEAEYLRMEGKVSVIGLQGSAKWILLDNSTTFDAQVESDLFEEITLKGNTSDVEDIKRVKMALQGEVNSDLSRLSEELRSSLNGWAQGIRKILDKNQANVDDLKQVTEEKGQELCKQNECELVKQCLSVPERKCVKYATKEVCTEHILQCKAPNLICQDQENVLVGYSSSSTTSESHTANVCRKLQYQCGVGNFTVVCDNTENADDESQCESYGWTCQEGTVTNFGCQSECDRRVRVHKKFQAIYEDTQTKIDSLRTKIQGLESFLNNTGSGNGLEVTKVTFAVLADKLLVQSDFVWNITYKLGDVEHSVSLKGLNLVDFEETADSIFQEIGKAEGKLAGFEWKTLEEYNAYLNQEMIGNTPVGIFLELGAKKNQKSI